ncbi:hypothetical protein PG993_004803 [Apiospora rasikravindrae]|uniref:Methyltransferase domain-containing protein n=1 Tax=Apiospora rasikravindrae TaxID=990691 RepID=A0ABR1TGB7_9PEZI
MSPASDQTAQHDGTKAAMGGLVLCPLDLDQPGLKILDSGTGDGYWLQDLLATFPRLRDGTLVGTDVTAAKFPENGVQPPISLQIQSITQPWPPEWKHSFDLVHQRLVLGACGNFPYETAIRNLAKLVKPGGWIQLVEPDQTCGVQDGPAMRDFIALVTWVFERMGGHARYAYHVKQWLQDAGVVDVEERSIPNFLGALVPDADLARRTARWTADAMMPLLKYTQAYDGPTPIPRKELQTLVLRLHEELLTRGGLYPLRVLYGRMPLTQEQESVD